MFQQSNLSLWYAKDHYISSFLLPPVSSLGRQIDGRVQITHLVDGFVKDFKKIHSIGALVKAKVLKYVNLEIILCLYREQDQPVTRHYGS